MGRNSGIFWALNISSNFFGNIFVFFQFRNKGTGYQVSVPLQRRRLLGDFDFRLYLPNNLS
jgi:hypothetical protein